MKNYESLKNLKIKFVNFKLLTGLKVYLSFKNCSLDDAIGDTLFYPVKLVQRSVSAFHFNWWLAVLKGLGTIVSLEQVIRVLKPAIPLSHVLLNLVPELLLLLFFLVVYLFYIKKGCSWSYFLVSRIFLHYNFVLVLVLVEIFVGRVRH